MATMGIHFVVREQERLMAQLSPQAISSVVASTTEKGLHFIRRTVWNLILPSEI
jgi:hypothetical protein